MRFSHNYASNPAARCLLCGFILVLIVGSAVFYGSHAQPAGAATSKLTWLAVDTPSAANNVVVSPSEVNFIAIGSDDRTFYALDVANQNIYKSSDRGTTWKTDLKAALINAGAVFPAWNLAVAPDDPNFIAVVTSSGALPRRLYVSTDAGVTWNDSALTVAAPANISSVDISQAYGTENHDIAVGVRTGAAGGLVYTRKAPGISAWVAQNAPAMNWTAGDVITVKFSPNYAADSGLAIVLCNATGTYLNIGRRDTAANATDWKAIYITPIELTNGGAGSSAKVNQIITADIEMPSDIDVSNPALRRVYACYDDIGMALSFAGVYRVDDTVAYRIFTATSVDRIASIAYYGYYGSGILLAGDVTTDPTTGAVTIWRSANPQALAATWSRSTKSPTGGGNNAPQPAGRANAQLAWSNDGNRAYCGTSSAALDNLVVPAWPGGYLAAKPLDESAFSISPCTYFYQEQVKRSIAPLNEETGNNWVQVSLIDTAISTLSDMAALGVPEGSSDYPVLYLTSVNTSIVANAGFDSVWRSTSDPLGIRWERVICFATGSNNILMRVNLRTPKTDEVRSRVIVAADQLANNVRFSKDEGQNWVQLYPGVNITDCALSSDITMYVLDNTFVRKGNYGDAGWLWDARISTRLDAGHMLFVLPEKVQKQGATEVLNQEKWVIVGEANPASRVSYCDFNKLPLNFERINVPLPVTGNVHALLDEGFTGNGFIYAGSHDLPGIRGKIYRWIAGSSTTWEDMQPPNSAFYGVVQRLGALYGAWRLPTPPTTTVGVDRVLEPKASPIPLEWDDLTFGLPAGGAVAFTREPSALKVSSNGNTDLWAIDNNAYNFTARQGCLWLYTDTLVRNGPWTLAPPSGDFISIDPVTGRAGEVNFRWRDLADAMVYELWIAKDEKFTQQIATFPSITPVDPLDPAWILFPGPLEANHKYFWKVRVTGGATGEVIHSPWSATMFFSVQAGLPVNAYSLQPQLLNPKNAFGCSCDAPVPFSWSTLKEIKKYRFELSENTDMSSPLISRNVDLPAFLYDGTLKCGRSYFWRVRAVEPFPSDWSAIFTFTMKPAATGQPLAASATANSDDQFSILLWGMIVILVVFFLVMVAFIRARLLYVNARPSAQRDSEIFVNRPRNPVSRAINWMAMRIRRKRNL